MFVAPFVRLTFSRSHQLLGKSSYTLVKCLSTEATAAVQQQSNQPELQSSDIQPANNSEDLDTLYKSLLLEIKAHDQPVLKSYEKFVLQVSQELNVPFVKSWEPWRHIFRKPLLKSVFIYKDHRAVYEFRTYFLMMQFKNMTGSTMDTFLEYIERNLPEGVHMKVTKTALAKFPDHLNPKQALQSE